MTKINVVASVPAMKCPDLAGHVEKDKTPGSECKGAVTAGK
jgi:hypothetical protein